MNPWIIVGFLVVLIASNGATAYIADDYGYGRAEAKYTKRDNEKLIAANKTILNLTGKVRAIEERSASLLSDISTKNIKELKNAQSKFETVVADIRTGKLRLFDSDACARDSSSTSSKTISSPGGCHGGTRGQFLSRNASVFLAEKFNQCDKITIQLASAQAVIRADRAIGDWNPQ